MLGSVRQALKDVFEHVVFHAIYDFGEFVRALAKNDQRDANGRDICRHTRSMSRL